MNNVFEFLDSLGVSYRVIEHPAVFRVGEEPPELDGTFATKNLLLKEAKTGQVYMVTMEGEKKLDLLKLAEAIGTSKNKLRFLKYDEVEPVVGVVPGHVSVLNLLNPDTKSIKVVFDEALLRQKEIGSHPNVNTATVLMSPETVLEVMRRLGQDPLVVPL